MPNETEKSDRAPNTNEKSENCYCSALPKGSGCFCPAIRDGSGRAPRQCASGYSTHANRWQQAQSRGEWMAVDVRRRKFIVVLSGALAGRAIPAYAQQAARTYTVGVLWDSRMMWRPRPASRLSNEGWKRRAGRSARAYGSSIALQVATPTLCGHSPKTSPNLSPTAFLATAPQS